MLKGLTIPEAARSLEVDEKVIRGHIAAGRLTFEVEGGQVVIPQPALEDLKRPDRSSTPMERRVGDTSDRSPQEDVLRFIMKELFALQEQLENKWELINENKRLHQLLRERDRAVGERNAEIERLKREMVHQKRLAEKDLEDRERTLGEKIQLLEDQMQIRIAREQEMYQEKVALLERDWTDRMAREEEGFSRRLAESRKHEGLWTRLVKMMTWS